MWSGDEGAAARFRGWGDEVVGLGAWIAMGVGEFGAAADGVVFAAAVGAIEDHGVSNLPMKTAMLDLRGRPKYMLGAPELQGGRCSDCGVVSIAAGDGDLRVCPCCYALLWHRDWSAELRRAREQAVAAAAALAKEVKAAREKARRGSHVVSTKMPSASVMTMRTQRRRLIGLLWGRTQALWRERI